MSQTEWIQRGKNVIMHTYNSFPVILKNGDGMYVWDENGKKYLDFVSGIAVNSLGYKHRTYIDQLTKQIEKLTHCSNLYWNMSNIELAELLIENSGFDKVFFCNSGTEAVEAALKLSRKYGKLVHGRECIQIITMKQSFHGRTFGAITATGQEKYHKGLSPMLPGISYAPFNDFAGLKQMVTEKTCAIMLEPIQGEGGIRPVEKEFLQNVRNLCTEKNIILIFDEVQSGIGRTGKLFAYEYYDVQPDVITLAKGLGGGFPIGAMMAVERVAKAFLPGDHASTFGGNPLASTAAKTVLTEIFEQNLLSNVTEQGNYLKERLLQLQEISKEIIDIRGVGLMLGMEMTIQVAPIIQKCMERGLLLISAGSHVIRFVPPLICQKDDIDAAILILQDVLGEE